MGRNTVSLGGTPNTRNLAQARDRVATRNANPGLAAARGAQDMASAMSAPLPVYTPPAVDTNVYDSGPAGPSVPQTPADAFGNPILSDEEYLKNDSMFQAQKNALQAALDAYIADSEAQRQTYGTNYGESLRKLGFTGDQGALDKAKWDPTENNGQGRWEDPSGNPFAGKIDWNQTDVNTASGRGFESALNDFAARGMLQSSAYQRAYNNLQRQLNEQLSSTAGAKQTAMGEFDRAQAAKRTEKTTSEAQASQEALARIKAAYGIG